MFALVQEELPLASLLTVDNLDSEAAVLAAGLKAKHVGKQLFRLQHGAEDWSIVFEAADPEALATWIAALSAAALELDAAVKERQSQPAAGRNSTTSASMVLSPKLAAFHSRNAPQALGSYTPPSGGWPSGNDRPSWQHL